MTPQTIRNPHGRRKEEIPVNLVQKWQSSPRRLPRPQVRRPRTACERCRTAKVRCHGDGQNGCGRCTSRGLPCRYGQTDPSPGPTATPSGSNPDRTTTREDIPPDSELSAGHTAEFAGDNAISFPQIHESSIPWTNSNRPTETLTQHEYMDWSSVDPAITLDLSGVFQDASTPASRHQPSLDSLGLLPLITNTTAENFPWEHQLASQSCQCRTGLAQLIPDARAALRQRQLSEVFQVTRDVIQKCEGIAGCEACGVNCTDLICIMAVFQEVDGCFEYVAKGEIAGEIKVSIGSYEIEAGSSDQDAKEWRMMLVRQLVRRADRLLDSISATGQDMLRRLDPECRLGRVNIDYLEAVIRNSRENLHRTIEGLENARAAGQEL